MTESKCVQVKQEPIWFAYKVSCAATVGSGYEARDFWDQQGSRANAEARLKQAGYLMPAGFDAARCRLEPEQLVLVGRFRLDPPSLGWWGERIPSKVAHDHVMHIVHWTLAALYRCREIGDRTDPDDLDLRIRQVAPTATERATYDHETAQKETPTHG